MSNTGGAQPPVDEPGRPAPGDARPRVLDRPPGERYVRPSQAPAPLDHPRLVTAVAGGLGAVAVVAIAFAIVSSGVDLPLLLIPISAAGGLLIGYSVRRAAWSGMAHVPSRLVVGLAVALGALGWLAAEVASWLLSLATLPLSDLSFPERVRNTPFADWLSPQFSGLEILEIFLFIGLAWFAVRD